MRSHFFLTALGKKIIKVRDAQGLSQRQLALKSGVDNSALSKIELGKINVTLLRLIKISNGLDIPICELMPTNVKVTRMTAGPSKNQTA